MHKYHSTKQFKDVIRKVKENASYHKEPIPTLQFKGTVKLHGSNGSVYNKLTGNKLVCQSKNNIITPEKDNMGFAVFVNKNESLFQNMFNIIKQAYPQHLETQTAVVYGEWVGAGTMKGAELGINKIEKSFVIFSMKFIENKDESLDVLNVSDNSDDDSSDVEEELAQIWLSEDEMQNILKKVGVETLNKNRIYSIYDFPTFSINIDINNPKMMQNELIRLTTEVENKCPVSAQLGIDGIGEGIVWRCVSPSRLPASDLIFKVKGEKHSVSKVKTIAEVDIQKLNSINEFVEMVVTENRLIQGLEYLKEQHLELVNTSIGAFLKWFANDCIKEEGDVLIESGLDKKDVMGSISNKAKNWYLTKLNEQLQESNEVKVNKPKI